MGLADESPADLAPRVGIYSNISAAYQLGRALSAGLAGTIAVVVAALYSPAANLLIVPAVLLVGWDAYRQRARPRATPMTALATDALIVVAAMTLLRPPPVMFIGPIAVVLTAAMLLLPWQRTLTLLTLGSGITWLALLIESPFAVTVPEGLSSVLALLLPVAFLPNFVILLRGTNQALIERQMLTRELRRRLRYEHALATCSQVLLASASSTSLSSALESLLEASDVDAIVVARNATDAQGEATREIVTVVNRSVRAPYVLAGAPFRWADIPHVRDVLRQGQSYFYVKGEVSAGEAEVFEAAGIESDLVIPIGVNGVWAGYISFTDCSGRARWGSYDLELLPSVARMIGAHWTRLENAERLEAMIDYKDEFVASVSHELRTPLTAVVGFAEQLRDNFDSMGPAEARELVDLVSEQSLEVAHIVEDLLVVARLGGDSLTLVPEEVCVLTEADQVVRSLGMLDRVRYTGETDCYAVADSGRLRQILRNLLTNARRYGGDQIVVNARYRGQAAVIRVLDNGSGIPERLWEQIFEPYQRMSQPSSTPGSVGLGLTVSRELARLMGGDLSYRFLGGWSEFEVSVPISARAEAAVGG